MDLGIRTKIALGDRRQPWVGIRVRPAACFGGLPCGDLLPATPGRPNTPPARSAVKPAPRYVALVPM